MTHMKESHFVIDGTNNNYVRGFASEKDANDWINRHIRDANWENNWESEQDYRDEFAVIEKEDMDAKAKKYGKRVRQYYN